MPPAAMSPRAVADLPYGKATVHSMSPRGQRHALEQQQSSPGTVNMQWLACLQASTTDIATMTNEQREDAVRMAEAEVEAQRSQLRAELWQGKQEFKGAAERLAHFEQEAQEHAAMLAEQSAAVQQQKEYAKSEQDALQRAHLLLQEEAQQQQALQVQLSTAQPVLREEHSAIWASHARLQSEEQEAAERLQSNEREALLEVLGRSSAVQDHSTQLWAEAQRAEQSMAEIKMALVAEKNEIEKEENAMRMRSLAFTSEMDARRAAGEEEWQKFQAQLSREEMRVQLQRYDFEKEKRALDEEREELQRPALLCHRLPMYISSVPLWNVTRPPTCF